MKARVLYTSIVINKITRNQLEINFVDKGVNVHTLFVPSLLTGETLTLDNLTGLLECDLTKQ